MAQPAHQLPIAEPVFRLYPCAPPVVRSRLSGRLVTSARCPIITLPAPLRRFVRTPERIDPLAFAERHRAVTDGAHIGPWRREHAPHTAQILRTIGKPWVREVWYCGVDQSGKTITATNFLAWAIEQLSGDIFWLMPSEETAKNIVDQKLRPMLEQSPHLRGYLSPRKDDTAITRIRLANGKTIRPSWASSALATATWSAQVYICDEVDKYPFATTTMGGTDKDGQGGKEKDPITAIRLRARTFRGREKGFFASTPAGRFIRKNTMACPQVQEYRLRCPHCAELIRPEGEHLLLADNATVADIERDGATMACPSCGAQIDEQQRIQAIRGGAWVAIKGGELTRPERVGFIHRAWDCLDVSIREIAIAWLKKQAGSLTDKIAWANGVEADDYQHVQVDRVEDHILRLVDEQLPRGVVPRDTAALLLLVDTQKRGFFYQVWACGFGPDVTTSMIDHGYVERFQHLVDMTEKEWIDSDGKQHRVLRGYIDSGGGTDPHNRKHSRTSAVYEFCRRHRLFRPLKGNTRQDALWSAKKIDYYPTRTGRKIPMVNGPILYKIQVNHFKDELAERLLINPDQPGGIRLHAGTDTGYATQMCAEYADERGVWHCPRGRANHHWDIGVYLRASITIEQLANKRPEAKRMGRTIKKPERSFVKGWR